MPIVSEPLGRVLGNRYRLVAALASGPSAHVFLAEDVVLRRRVAVKVLQPELAQDDAFLRRFRAEARSVAALNHRHVLKVFDWGEGEDGPYMVLEHLEGGSLADLLAQGRRLSPAQAARVGAEAAAGLAYAHERGLVHRAVKPANILFDEDGGVRVGDFGVAPARWSASNADTSSLLAATPYASPQQAAGQALDGRSDVYSLGLVLYEAVTGKALRTANAPAAAPPARRISKDPSLGPLGPVLAAACAAEPSGRPDAAHLAERLAGLAADLGPGAPLPLVRRADGRHEDAATTSLGLADTGEPTATIKVGDGPPPGIAVHALRRAPRRRRWPWVVLAVLVVLCLLAAGAVYLMRGRLFTTTHVVPAVVGDTLASARQALRADHFKVKVGAGVTSTRFAAGDVVRQSPRQGAVLVEGSTVRLVPSSGEPTVQVPQLTSAMDCSLARQLLAERHLRTRCPALSAYSKTVPKGDILNWSYDGKLDPTSAPYGATILVAVSEGRQPVQVATYKGQSYTQVAATLGADGLTVKEAQAYSTTVGAGKVISTTPPAGSTLPVPSVITVNVSKGPAEVPVPTVVGDTVQKATAAIDAAGLTVGKVYGPSTGVVFTTDPLHGQKEKVGTPVLLYTEPPPSTGAPKPGSKTSSSGSGGAPATG